MNTLVSVALTNALTVLPLAMLVFCVVRYMQNAALKHTLWVLVLAKLVTPPLFTLPVEVALPPPELSHVDVMKSQARTAVAETAGPPTAPIPDGVEPAVVAPVAIHFDEHRHAATSPPWTERLSRMASHWLRFWQLHPGLQMVCLIVWAGGTIGWTLLQLVRAIRFERLIASCPCVPTRLQQQTNALAADLGLKRAPQVFVIDAAVSPMLWGCGRRAKLLFPADLALRLDDESRATLITHELAHFSRGDHLVRLLELVATALFWWHPVLWWARSQIEQAEEECCDAWVVRQFPHVPRRYAEALLDTIDFLCESRRALPPLASGLGQAPFLRRRLTQIMQGPRLQPVSPQIRLAILLAALTVLPMQPFALATPSWQPAMTRQVPDFIQELVQDAEVPPASEIEAATVPAVAPSDVAKTPPPTALPKSRPIVRGTRRNGVVWSTAVSPDGRFVIRPTTARRIMLTDLALDSITDLSDQNITAVAFHPDESRFAAAGSDGRITIWDSSTGKLNRVLAEAHPALRTIAIAPDGRSLATGSVDGRILVYDLASGSVLLNLRRSSASVNCVRYSPNGRQLAVAEGDWISGQRGRVTVYELSDGEIAATLPCDSAPGAVAFASDEELIVGLWNGHSQLWNLATHQVVADARTDKSVIAMAGFSPDNPALREMTFVPVDASRAESRSPLSLLRGFLE